jgi:hypothetical protein
MFFFLLVTTSHAQWATSAAGDTYNTNSTGKVGVGVTFPSAKLHVLGGGTTLNAGNGYLFTGDFIVQANTGGRNINMGAQIEFAIPANVNGSNVYGQGRIITVAGNTVNANASGKMILGTRRYFNKLGTGAEWYYGDDLIIDAVGNIGIGVLYPDAKLTVDGSIKCEEVSVELVQGTGPDYVFEKEYNLLPLKELEAYINQNKHLPEVPSAKEMEANGLNLREMNLLLLKKVEELTLHLLEQNKINEQQKQLNEKLLTEIESIKKR